MSRKHFEAAAAEIKALYQAALPHESDTPTISAMKSNFLHRAQGAEDVWVSIASQFNPRFDSVRFRQACRP